MNSIVLYDERDKGCLAQNGAIMNYGVTVDVGALNEVRTIKLKEYLGDRLIGIEDLSDIFLTSIHCRTEELEYANHQSEVDSVCRNIYKDVERMMKCIDVEEYGITVKVVTLHGGCLQCDEGECIYE